MAKAPAFQFFASDFDMDTKAWTISETGIYIRLLMYQWVNIDLPVEPSRLARIAGCDVRTLQKCWKQTIAKKFVTNERGMLQNYKLESIRKEREEFIKKKENSARLGGLKTQENRRKESSTASTDASNENKALQSSTSSSSSKDNHIIKDDDRNYKKFKGLDEKKQGELFEKFQFKFISRDVFDKALQKIHDRTRKTDSYGSNWFKRAFENFNFADEGMLGMVQKASSESFNTDGVKNILKNLS